jgi:hypothetical protein
MIRLLLYAPIVYFLVNAVNLPCEIMRGVRAGCLNPKGV